MPGEFDMRRMQEEAARRAREMQSRARIPQPQPRHTQGQGEGRPKPEAPKEPAAPQPSPAGPGAPGVFAGSRARRCAGQLVPGQGTDHYFSAADFAEQRGRQPGASFFSVLFADVAGNNMAAQAGASPLYILSRTRLTSASTDCWKPISLVSSITASGAGLRGAVARWLS